MQYILNKIKRSSLIRALSLMAVGFALFGLLAVAVINANAATGINPQLNYQGKIANASSVPLSGSYNFRFEIYDASTGGTMLWQETWNTGTTQVNIVNGVFSVPLGSITTIDRTMFNNDSLYLQIYFDADGNGTFEETFSPRKRLTSAPYAFNADAVDSFHATTTATANQLLVLDANGGMTLGGVTTTGGFYVGGNAGIGRVNPSYKLDILNTGTLGAMRTVSTFTNTTASFSDLVHTTNISLSGNQSGSSTFYALNNTIQTANDSNIYDPDTQMRSLSFVARHQGSQTFPDIRGGFIDIQNTGSGNLTNARGLDVYIRNTGGGTITNAYAYYARGLSVLDGSVTNAYGFYANNFTSSTNAYGFYSALTSGAGKYNVYSAGSAVNYFAGDVGIGTISPSTKLEIVGSVSSTGLQINGNANITGSTILGSLSGLLWGTNGSLSAVTTSSLGFSEYSDAKARSAISTNANGLSYSGATGILSLDLDRNIPLVVSTTNWNNAYNIVVSSSSNWDLAYATTTANGAHWTSAYNSVTASSSQWYSFWPVSNTVAYLGASNVFTGLVNYFSIVSTTLGLYTNGNLSVGGSSVFNGDVTGTGFTSGIDNRVSSTWRGKVNGLASLGADGKVPDSQLSPLAITNTYTVSSESEMLTLAAHTGDVAIRTDLTKSFILRVNDPTVLSNWVELIFPTDAVTSVNGKRGAVTLSTDNIGEGLSNFYFTAARFDDRMSSMWRGKINGVASLGPDGKIPTSELGALPINDTFVVAATSSLLTTSASKGDIGISTNLNKTYVLQGTDASIWSNWVELLTDASVVSVNGLTGAVNLTTTNIDEGDNQYWTQGRFDTALAGATTWTGDLFVSGGNIGIGVASTTQALEVAGNASTSNNMYVGNNLYVGYGNGANSDVIYFDQGLQSLAWNTTNNRFEISDGLYVSNNVTATSLYISGQSKFGVLDGLAKLTNGVLSAITDNTANWDTAFGWGNWKTGITASNPITYNSSTGAIGWTNSNNYLASTAFSVSGDGLSVSTTTSGVTYLWTNPGYLTNYNSSTAVAVFSSMSSTNVTTTNLYASSLATLGTTTITNLSVTNNSTSTFAGPLQGGIGYFSTKLLVGASSLPITTRLVDVADGGKGQFNIQGTASTGYGGLLIANDNGNFGTGADIAIIGYGGSVYTDYGNASSSLFLAVPSSRSIRSYIGATNLMTLNSTGVGIGTSTPSKTLHVTIGGGSGYAYALNYRGGAVFDSSADNIIRIINGSSTAGLGEIWFGDPSNEARSRVRWDAANSVISLWNGSNSVSVNSSGFLGINTVAPSSSLEIVGTTDYNQLTLSRSKGYGAVQRVGLLGAMFDNSQKAYGMIMGRSTSIENELYIGGGNTAVNPASWIAFYTSPSTTTVAGSERMRISELGNVGIGTTIPNTQLDVAGTANGGGAGILTLENKSNESAGSYTGLTFNVTPYAYSNLYNKGGIYYSATGGYGRGDIIFAQNSGGNTSNVYPSDAVMTIQNGGNVGVGTTTPGSKLTVSGGAITVDNNQNIRLTNSTGANYAFLNMSTGNNFQIVGATGLTQYSAGSSHVFYTGGSAFSTELMRITNTGNVGIGTTAPTDRLVVASSTAGGVGGIITTFNPATATLGNTAEFRFKPSSDFIAGYWGAGISNILTNASTLTSDIAFTSLYPSTLEIMRLTGDGNVGIGTTTPAYPLDIYSLGGPADLYSIYARGRIISNASNPYGLAVLNGTNSGFFGVTTNDKIQISNGSAGTVRVSIDNGGKVGIGTTSPAGLLHLGANGYGLVITNSNNANSLVFRNSGLSYGTDQWIQYLSGTDFRFYGTGGDRLTLTQTGDLTAYGQLIGASMQINGNATTTGILSVGAGSANSNSVLEFDNAGVKEWTMYNATSTNSLYIAASTSVASMHVLQGGTTWVSDSDLRLKENLVPIDDALSKVLNLTGYVYNFKGSGRREVGLIAQEVQPNFPELVDASGPYMGLMYDRIGPVLVQAIKEQQVQIDLLKSQLASTTPIAQPAPPSQDNLIVTETDPYYNTLKVASAANFYGTINVMGEAGFTSKVTFRSEVEFQSHITVDSDTAGSAIIATGTTSTIVRFTKAYNTIPKVMAVLNDDDDSTFINWKIKDKTSTTFAIILSTATNKSISFDWFAVAVKGAEGRVAGASETLIPGCMDSTAINYNANATQSDGSCTYRPVTPVVEPITPSSTDPVIPATTTDPVVPESNSEPPLSSVIFTDESTTIIDQTVPATP